MQDQLIDLDGIAELADEGEVGRVVVVLRWVVTNHTAVLLFGHVHGDVGTLEEIVDVNTVIGSHHEPDARIDGEWKAADADLVLDHGPYPPEDFGRIGDVAQDDPEFIAAEPGHIIRRTHEGDQAM